jgi:hypothetical protein
MASAALTEWQAIDATWKTMHPTMQNEINKHPSYLSPAIDFRVISNEVLDLRNKLNTVFMRIGIIACAANGTPLVQNVEYLDGLEVIYRLDVIDEVVNRTQRKLSDAARVMQAITQGQQFITNIINSNP